jgi:hypothetical protein
MPLAVRVAELPDGALAYAIAVSPEALPAVAPDALLAAWRLAREAAAARRWGRRRQLRFDGAGAAPTDLAIADPDAAAWAEAIDEAVGLDSLPGLTLCLRLLALIEVLTRASWLAPLFDVTPDGVDLHPRLLAAAATLPLDASARLDEPGLRRHLAPMPVLS